MSTHILSGFLKGLSMLTNGTSRAPHQIIEAELRAYREALSPPDPDWPPDIAAVVEGVHARLFTGIRVRDVRERCGLYDNNISIRFREIVGRTIQEYIIYHRIALAKRLLQHEEISIIQIAFSVGFGSPSGFSTTYQRWEGEFPSMYRQKCLKKYARDPIWLQTSFCKSSWYTPVHQSAPIAC